MLEEGPLPVPEILKEEQGVFKKLDIRENCRSKELIISIVEKCNSLISDLKTKYVLIGGCLIDLKSHCSDIWSYEKGRYCKDIYEVAKQVFNFCKTTTKNVIGIARKFGDYLCCLKKQYEPYTYKQLVVMLPLNDEQLSQVNPLMSEQDIKSISKQGKIVGQLVDQNDENAETLINKGVGNFLVLKNDTERLDFLKMYKCWGVWLELPELNLTFYKCDLDNGDFICITEYPRFKIKTSWGEELFAGVNDKRLETHAWHKCIVRKGTSPDNYGYDHVGVGDTEFLNYMKSTKAKPLTIRAYSNFSEYKKDMEV